MEGAGVQFEFWVQQDQSTACTDSLQMDTVLCLESEDLVDGVDDTVIGRNVDFDHFGATDSQSTYGNVPFCSISSRKKAKVPDRTFDFGSGNGDGDRSSSHGNSVSGGSSEAENSSGQGMAEQHFLQISRTGQQLGERGFGHGFEGGVGGREERERASCWVAIDDA